jgi:hypothetical protein
MVPGKPRHARARLTVPMARATVRASPSTATSAKEPPVVCPRCGGAVPDEAGFCPACGATVGASCPHCGAENSRASRFCSTCGRPRVPAVANRLRASPQDYTPGHLARKIATSRFAIEGERKQVTVLFADLKSSLELLVDRDPEDARRILDPLLHSLMEGVHHYEGTVNQVLGDGIMPSTTTGARAMTAARTGTPRGSRPTRPCAHSRRGGCSTRRRTAGSPSSITARAGRRVRTCTRISSSPRQVRPYTTGELV